MSRKTRKQIKAERDRALRDVSHWRTRAWTLDADRSEAERTVAMAVAIIARAATASMILQDGHGNDLHTLPALRTDPEPGKAVYIAFLRHPPTMRVEAVVLVDETGQRTANSTGGVIHCDPAMSTLTVEFPLEAPR